MQALIIVFKGETEHPIPLYDVGIFILFPLSQTGMILKWVREKPKGRIPKLIINSIGALISFTITMTFFLTKFRSVLVFLLVIILVFHRIRKHFEAAGGQCDLIHASLLTKIYMGILQKK